MTHRRLVVEHLPWDLWTWYVWNPLGVSCGLPNPNDCYLTWVLSQPVAAFATTLVHLALRGFPQFDDVAVQVSWKPFPLATAFNDSYHKMGGAGFESLPNGQLGFLWTVFGCSQQIAFRPSTDCSGLLDSGFFLPFLVRPDCILSQLRMSYVLLSWPIAVQSLTPFLRLDKGSMIPSASAAPLGSKHAGFPIFIIVTIPKFITLGQVVFSQATFGRWSSKGVPEQQAILRSDSAELSFH